MSDREIGRHVFRQGLFQRRGEDAAHAEVLADRLLERDRDLDTRRLCLECAHFQPNGGEMRGSDGCFAASQGWLGPIGRFFSPLRTTLQRCAQFKWQAP